MPIWRINANPQIANFLYSQFADKHLFASLALH